MNEVIFLGIIYGMIFTEITSISPGGLIVPAYLAIYLGDPIRILTTIILSIICVFIVRVLEQFMIIYGRRKFFIYLVVGILLKHLLSYSIVGENYFDFGLSIGYLIPGILGREIDRQGFVNTFLGMGIVIMLTVITKIFLWG